MACSPPFPVTPPCVCLESIGFFDDHILTWSHENPLPWCLTWNCLPHFALKSSQCVIVALGFLWGPFLPKWCLSSRFSVWPSCLLCQFKSLSTFLKFLLLANTTADERFGSHCLHPTRPNTSKSCEYYLSTKTQWAVVKVRFGQLGMSPTMNCGATGSTWSEYVT